MKFAQLLDNHTLAPGASVRTSFSANNIQGLIIKTDAGTSWDDVFLNVNVGSDFYVSRCSLTQLLQINAFHKGFNLLSAGQDAVVYVELGSIYLKSNEEIEVYLDCDSSVSSNKIIDVTAVYNSDYPPNHITYQTIVDSNFSRDNVAEIWAFGTGAADLSENSEVLTIQNDFGSQSTRVKVFNQWTNSQSNNETYVGKSAQIYTDPDGILTKVTCSISAMGSTGNEVTNFVVVCNDSDETTQTQNNQEYLEKKKAKLASLSSVAKRINRLKGLL